MKTFLRSLISLSLLLTIPALAKEPLRVAVKEGKTTYLGTLHLPPRVKGSLPLVIVVPEWWGKNEYPEKRAAQIANQLGYAALAVDVYGEGKTVSTPKEAQEISAPFYQDPMMGVTRLQAFVPAAVETAKMKGITIDTKKIAAIGYCFGGTQVINLVRAGGLKDYGKLLGIVSFHGGLASSLKAQGSIPTRILVLTGAADPMVDAKQVAAFKEEMKGDHADFEVIEYPGAKHAFTNPNATKIGKKYDLPIAYDAAADKDSWKRMKAFLAGIFPKK